MEVCTPFRGSSQKNSGTLSYKFSLTLPHQCTTRGGGGAYKCIPKAILHTTQPTNRSNLEHVSVLSRVRTEQPIVTDRAVSSENQSSASAELIPKLLAQSTVNSKSLPHLRVTRGSRLTGLVSGLRKLAFTLISHLTQFHALLSSLAQPSFYDSERCQPAHLRTFKSSRPRNLLLPR